MTAELKVCVGQYSDKGRKAINQDFYGFRVPQNSLLAVKGIALAMADGISSSDFSHVASETAVKSFLEDYYCTSEAWSVKGSVERVLNATNSWLYTHTLHSGNRYDKDKGYVCTFSALIIKNLSAYVFHVGDTRIYRLNADGLEQLTNDHRLWVTQEKSYLSRALGFEAQCSFDHQVLGIKTGDLFIIATDGVYEFIGTQNIINTIENYDNLNGAAQSIVEQAYEQGSDDNLSIQIVRIEQLPEQTSKKVKQKIEQLPLPPKLSARMEFDGYSILRDIHTSNRSHVYLAIDNETQNKVVLKVPSTESGKDDNFLEHFLMEEWVARRINSAHVLKANLPNKKRNYLYTVFEYIEGQSLSQWAIDNVIPNQHSDDKLNIETVRGIIEQIAKGLQAFHRMEMLHQDLRPENIMIATDGTVKIIDFGSVSIAGIEETKTEPPLTYLQGTALYSAPEYFLGQPGTTQSELFSLGVITYFLLSGRYPYGTNVAKAKTLAAQRKLEYRTVLHEDREIPVWVDDAIRKAVHPLPDKRQEGIFEFIHDLRHPNKSFLNKNRLPLIERNPVAFWQGVSSLLLIIIIYLLSQ